MEDKYTALEWYYSINGQSFGPYPESQIIDLIKNGTIRPGTFVWNKNMSGWAAVETTPLAVHMGFNAAGGPGAVPPSAPAAGLISWSKHKRVKRSTYLLLNMFLGAFGVQKFYAGNPISGVMYLLMLFFGSGLIVPLLALCILVIVDLVQGCRAPDVPPYNGDCII